MASLPDRTTENILAFIYGRETHRNELADCSFVESFHKLNAVTVERPQREPVTRRSNQG